MERDDTWVMMDMLPGGLETEDDFVMIDPGNLQPPPPHHFPPLPSSLHRPLFNLFVTLLTVSQDFFARED